MARKPEINYWTARGSYVDAKGKLCRGGYWTTIKGEKILLAAGPKDEPTGPTYLAALGAFKNALALSNADRAKDGNTCAVIFAHYLRDLEPRATPKTVENRRVTFRHFAEHGLADLPVASLTPTAVKDWLLKMREPRKITQRLNGRTVTRSYCWGDGRVWNAIRDLQAAFHFGVAEKLITVNPIEGMKRPPARTRSRDLVLRPQDHETILARTRGQFREFIICLENTGCRPSELLLATSADWRSEHGALIYYAADRRLAHETGHKNDKKGKDRTIFFRGEARAIMERRVRELPAHGTPPSTLWRQARHPDRDLRLRQIESAFEKLAKRVGMPGLSAYTYRHTYATRYLENGGSIDDLAELMGSSPENIRRHYAHLCKNLDRISQLADRFTAARTEGAPTLLPFRDAAGQ